MTTKRKFQKKQKIEKNSKYTIEMNSNAMDSYRIINEKSLYIKWCFCFLFKF